MPEIAGVAAWVWAVVFVAIVAGGIGGFFVWRVVSRGLTRRYLVRLAGMREAVVASQRTLEAVMRHLVDEPDEGLMAFAADRTSEDRRALTEVAARSVMLRDELDSMPVPVALLDVTEELADLACVIAEESGRVSDNQTSDEVLGALAEVDLGRVTRQFETAIAALEVVSREYDVEDTAVYGGGLYI